MCTFSPESIFPYLVSHDDYPLDACLKICQQFGINDATTYLLERTGDVSGALNMMLRTLNVKIEAMLETYANADMASLRQVGNTIQLGLLLSFLAKSEREPLLWNYSLILMLLVSKRKI